MKVEIFDNRSAQFFEENLRSSFQIPEENKIIICSGVAHALTEVTRGLHAVYPHRLGLAYQTDGGPDIENMLPFFSREGFPIHAFRSSELLEVENVASKLGKSGLFSVVADDDPVTGELFEHKALEAKLAESKSFSIRISYSSFLFDPLPIQTTPFSVRILSIAHNLAAVVLGSRANIERLLFGNVFFDESLTRQFSQLICKRSPDRKLVTDFEVKVSHFAKLYFSSTASRIYDRAILYFEDVDGSALLDEFEREMALSPSSKTSERKTETASLCRWGDKSMEWLKRRGLSPEQIRGLVALDLNFLDDRSAKALENVYHVIKKKQNG